jgi:hypothetical protein
MSRLLSQLSLLCLIFLSCNDVAHSINDSLKEDLADTKEVLRKEDEQARKGYRESYQSAMHHASEHGLQKLFEHLDSTIALGAHYMDSISGEMKLLEEKDPINMEYPKNLFLYKGVGDTLYDILTQVNDIAGIIALQTDNTSAVRDLRLTVLNQPTVDAWKKQDFAVLSPFTAMALLHGFTYEIFQVGKECLPKKNAAL